MNMKRMVITYAVLGLVGVVAALALGHPSPAQGLAGISKIAFTSERDHNRQIYVMNADGSNPVNLTKNPADDYQPAWAPAADKIAFTSTRDGNPEICTMNADGSNQTCITSNPTATHKPDKTLPADQLPTWAPDALHIAFASTRDGNTQVYVIEPSGGAALNLSSNAFNDDQPAWSPDLRSMAFSSDRAGNPEICVMDVSGFNQRCLTNNKTATGQHDPTKPADYFPTWSSDSQQLAYVQTQGSRSDLYVMNADGGNPHMLFKNVAPTEHPAWSPDGKSIAFVSLNRGKAEISIIGIDGKNQVGITAPSAVNFAPAWQPLPPPPGSTPTPVLTDTPVPTPQPPSPTPGGTSLIIGNQDVCAMKDGITLAVPLTSFKMQRGNVYYIQAGYTPGTFIATAGVKITATATLHASGLTATRLYLIREDVAKKVGVVNPVTQGGALLPGIIGEAGGPPSVGSSYTESYTFTQLTSFRVAVGGSTVVPSATASVNVTCTLVSVPSGATEAATEASTAAATAGLEIITNTPAVTPTAGS
ncbi:MAG: hypothetical protein ACYDBJ_27620 [Aggregatilineales bacterium]